MKIINSLLAVFLAAILAGCVSSSDKINSVRIGMNKDQVIALMGQPDSMSAQSNIEYLTYYLATESGTGRDQPYAVRLVDGKVESYGRFAQLFDIYNRPVGNGAPSSPYPPGAYAGPPAPASGLASELQKLKALRDQGVLTDDEFQRAKQKLLAP